MSQGLSVAGDDDHNSHGGAAVEHTFPIWDSPVWVGGGDVPVGGGQGVKNNGENDDHDMFALPPLDLLHDPAPPLPPSFSSDATPAQPAESLVVPPVITTPNCSSSSSSLVLSALRSSHSHPIITASRICGVEFLSSLPLLSSSSSMQSDNVSIGLWVYHQDTNADEKKAPTTSDLGFPLSPTAERVVHHPLSSESAATTEPVRHLLQQLPSWLVLPSSPPCHSTLYTPTPEPFIDGVAWTQSVSSLAYLPHWVRCGGVWVRYRDTHPIATFFTRLGQLFLLPSGSSTANSTTR